MVSAHASLSRLYTRHLSAVLGWNENIDVVSLAAAHRAAGGQIGGHLAGCAVRSGYSCWIIHNKVLRSLRGLSAGASQGEELRAMEMVLNCFIEKTIPPHSILLNRLNRVLWCNPPARI